MKRLWMIVIGAALAVAAVALLTYSSVSNKVIASEGPNVPALTMATMDLEAFKLHYPRHYDSYMKNKQELAPPLKFGGSKPVNNLDIFPYMRTLWAGYGFSKEYNEDRGHLWTVEDVTHIARVNDKTSLSCFYCKSADVPRMLEKLGDEYFKTNFMANKAEFSHPITCADCHNPTTMELRITRPALTEAMKRVGFDVSKATRQEMGSLVCAQCHVEYFFNPKEGGRITFPWDYGFDAPDMFKYYQDQGFADWTHPTSGAKMVKMQHPEYEVFQGSMHQANGLSCASCHMPMMKEGTAKISSHWMTSPLRTIEQSCGTCHNQGADALRDRVIYTQQRVKEQLDVAGFALAEAHNLIGEAAKNTKVDVSKLDQARVLVREGQLYWDYVAADNSMGFHNPQKALETIALGIDRAHRAQLVVKDALLAAK